jgi:hypothetical protein
MVVAIRFLYVVAVDLVSKLLMKRETGDCA